MDIPITINHSLKMEIKKKEFIQYFRERLQAVDVDANIQDVLLLLIQTAEDKFYKNNKKLGHVKLQAVLETIKGLLRKPLDDKQLTGIIDSIVLNQDIKRTPLYIRCYKYIKAYFLKPSAK